MASKGFKVGPIYGSVGAANGNFGGGISVDKGKNTYSAGLTGSVNKKGVGKSYDGPGIGAYVGKNVESSNPKTISVSKGSVSQDGDYKRTDINHGNLTKAIQNNPTAQQAVVNVQSTIDKVHKAVMALRSHATKGK